MWWHHFVNLVNMANIPLQSKQVLQHRKISHPEFTHYLTSLPSNRSPENYTVQSPKHSNQHYYRCYNFFGRYQKRPRINFRYFFIFFFIILTISVKIWLFILDISLNIGTCYTITRNRSCEIKNTKIIYSPSNSYCVSLLHSPPAFSRYTRSICTYATPFCAIAALVHIETCEVTLYLLFGCLHISETQYLPFGNHFTVEPF